MSDEKPELIDHPKHYNAHPSGVEAIVLCEHLGFNVGNAVKYLFRADHKGATIDDLKKAAWYLKRAVEKNDNAPYFFEDLSPSIKAVLEVEPEGRVLGDVIRALRLPDRTAPRLARLQIALLRVEREVAERERDAWRTRAEAK